MKAIILAGGFGTRISEESHLKPKPMIEIGGRPILWHILKIYSHYGINDFVICLGYKGYVIKEYFANYFLHASDVTIDMRTNQTEVHHRHAEPWRITLVDTGEATATGGRLKRVAPYIGDDDFCFTYGDGVSNVDIQAVIGQHQTSQALVTVTAVHPPGRFGVLDLEDDGRVGRFNEKPHGDGGWINGGFFVVSPKALDYIDGDLSAWEGDALPRLAEEGKMRAYQHRGFWQPMDTLRDKVLLEELWSKGQAPWKLWQ